MGLDADPKDREVIMDIFWFTGYVVWLILSALIASAFIVGAIVGVCISFRIAKEWTSLLAVALMTRMTREERKELYNACYKEQWNAEYNFHSVTKALRTIARQPRVQQIVNKIIARNRKL
jgi:hypothetical protein